MHLLSIGFGMYLEISAANAYLHMRDDAAKVGVKLKPNTAFRTMEYQELLYTRYQMGKGNLAAKPGYSNHQSGIAVDIDVTSSDTLNWLKQNAINYNFYFPIAIEPWHGEFHPEYKAKVNAT